MHRGQPGRARLPGCQGVVDYLGTADDVRSFVSASTAVVLLSYKEAMPRSLLEAAAMARLLIAADVPGCRDIEDGINARLCTVQHTIARRVDGPNGRTTAGGPGRNGRGAAAEGSGAV